MYGILKYLKYKNYDTCFIPYVVHKCIIHTCTCSKYKYKTVTSRLSMYRGYIRPIFLDRRWHSSGRITWSSSDGVVRVTCSTDVVPWKFNYRIKYRTIERIDSVGYLWDLEDYLYLRWIRSWSLTILVDDLMIAQDQRICKKYLVLLRIQISRFVKNLKFLESSWNMH